MHDHWNNCVDKMPGNVRLEVESRCNPRCLIAILSGQTVVQGLSINEKVKRRYNFCWDKTYGGFSEVCMLDNCSMELELQTKKVSKHITEEASQAKLTV
jgi:hypothetical protein